MGVLALLKVELDGDLAVVHDDPVHAERALFAARLSHAGLGERNSGDVRKGWHGLPGLIINNGGGGLVEVGRSMHQDRLSVRVGWLAL